MSQDLHTLTGAYAMDALDSDERLTFEEHLSTCPTCRDEVDGLRATAGRLADLASAPPPQDLRNRVLAEVSRTRQHTPGARVTPIAIARSRAAWYRQPATMAAALMLVVSAGLAGVAVDQSRDADRARAAVRSISAVLADPNRVEHTLASTGGGTGTLLISGDRAVFSGRALPVLPEGRAYQLWRLTGQQSESAGVLGRGGTVTGVVSGIRSGDRVGLTVEDAGGADRPTTAPVFLAEAA